MFHKFLAGAAVCMLMLGGTIVYAAGSTANVANSGVSVLGSRVFIDGVEVDAGVERYTSPSSGDVYRIRRQGESVAVVLERSGSGKSGTTRIESHASGRGATVNAGQVVITTGQ